MHSGEIAYPTRALVSFAQGHPSYLFDKEEHLLHRTTWIAPIHSSEFATQNHRQHAGDMTS